MHVGAHCHLSWAPFRTPALVRPSFHLPATPPGLCTTALAHPSPCMHVGAHHCPFAPLLWCAHPSVHVWLPHLGCTPPRSLALCTCSPCPPVPPACAQKERACGWGSMCKLGGGHGVVWVEGTVGGRVCRVGV